MKLHIAERFFGDIHYVWCATCFDSTKQAAYAVAARTPPSSDPYAIYKQMSADIKNADNHSAKIKEQRASMSALATKLGREGKLNPDQVQELVYIAKNSSITDWAPLLYVIPREIVKNRLELVHISKRASHGEEFIIKDLARNEFDVLEFI